MTYKSKNHICFTALLLFAALSFLFLSGCSSKGSEEDTASYRVTIENQSETEVYEISYSKGGEASEAGGGMYADGTPIKKGDDFSFTFSEEPGTLNLKFHDKEKEVIAVSSITPAFNEKRESTLLLISADGKLTLLHEN
ncbi:hypothetical protein [Proteiniclasticum ruminis]|uniref:Uncharacterized protein n=1 Tax=Proteiniclasticum ruminis TaxID=398199 RepID=A0A1I4XQF0_9CLOT|nr:hypothetical protein [Proteiniclasticum ruminis]SFN27489.1 hypothetical protein SAMN04488695_10195 [Proteiniclasticum ruminis]